MAITVVFMIALDWRHDFIINGREYDTIDMWRHLHRTLPASLAFIAPFYLTIEPWKHTAHTQPEYYSAMDAIVQHEVAEGMERELRNTNQWEVYERHVVDVLVVTTQMAQNGLPYDQAKAAEFEKELEEKQRIRLLRLQELVPDHLKPVKQKNGLKRQPKDVTGYVKRLFQVEIDDLAKNEVPFETNGDGSCVVERWALPEEFNPNSHLQKKALIKHFGHRLKTDRKSKKESADDHTLKSLITTYIESEKEQDKVAVECYQTIRECVAISKVLGTYVKGWRPGEDGLIHSTPGIWGDMYRISWRKPNLAATVADKKEVQIASGFRKCIAVPPSHVIIESDWKGMEAVLVAYFANDSNYMRLAGMGPHSYMASHIIGKPADLGWSDSDLRAYFREVKERNQKIYDDAKHCVHGISYGMTAYLMAELYEMTRTRAQWLIDLFFTLFPKVKQWQQNVIQEAFDKTKLVNAWGYRMPVWDALSWNQKRYDTLRKLKVRWETSPGDVFSKSEKAWIERMQDKEIDLLCYDLGTEAKSALAFYPRDSGAAMLKDAMLRLEDEYALASKGYMRACAHDSILAIAPRSEAEEVAEHLRAVQEAPQERLGGLIIRVDQSFGLCWDKKSMRSRLPKEVYATEAIGLPVSVPAQA